MVRLDDLSLSFVFFFLSPEELSLRAGQVNKQWYTVSIRNDIWRFMCYKLVSFSGKNNKISVDEFFDKNSIDTNIAEQYFKKVYYDKKHKSNLTILRSYAFQVTSSSVHLENDVSLLKYTPLTHSKQNKKSISFNVKIGEKPEFIEEIIRHRDLICVNEQNQSYMVVNLCEASGKQSRKNHASYKIMTKFVMKLSSPTLRKSKRWEFKLIEKQISMHNVMKEEPKQTSNY